MKNVIIALTLIIVTLVASTSQHEMRKGITPQEEEKSIGDGHKISAEVGYNSLNDPNSDSAGSVKITDVSKGTFSCYKEMEIAQGHKIFGGVVFSYAIIDSNVQVGYIMESESGMKLRLSVNKYAIGTTVIVYIEKKIQDGHKVFGEAEIGFPIGIKSMEAGYIKETEPGVETKVDLLNLLEGGLDGSISMDSHIGKIKFAFSSIKETLEATFSKGFSFGNGFGIDVKLCADVYEKIAPFLSF